MSPPGRQPQHRRADELTVTELHDLMRLRVEVFVVEQDCPYPELDGRDLDPTTGHWWFEDGGRIVAYLRTLEDPHGDEFVEDGIPHTPMILV